MNANSRYFSPQPAASLDDAAVKEIVADVMARANTQFNPEEIIRPSGELRTRIADAVTRETAAALRRRNLNVSTEQEKALTGRITDQMLGLGFLEELLPPRRQDVSEIMLNPDGSVYVIARGAMTAERAEGVNPSPHEVQLAIDKILGPQNRRATQAEPIVAAKLPPTPYMPAGARVNVVLPPVANGPYPSLNIRLYEPKPVRPEQIVGWGVMSREMMDFLRAEIHANHARVMIAGGTATGKTTLLSALANHIPVHERAVLIEDPAEIFIDSLPNLVSLEARPANVEGKYGVEMSHLVTTAMRMTPRWLVLGEVRTGAAAYWLLRAQMSGHAGLSTIHADTPKSAIETLCLLIQAERDVRFEATKRIVCKAIDYFVQIGFDRWGVRRCVTIARVNPELKAGDVYLDYIYNYAPETSTRERPVWRKEA